MACSHSWMIVHPTKLDRLSCWHCPHDEPLPDSGMVEMIGYQWWDVADVRELLRKSGKVEPLALDLAPVTEDVDLALGLDRPRIGRRVGRQLAALTATAKRILQRVVNV